MVSISMPQRSERMLRKPLVMASRQCILLQRSCCRRKPFECECAWRIENSPPARSMLPACRNQLAVASYFEQRTDLRQRAVAGWLLIRPLVTYQDADFDARMS